MKFNLHTAGWRYKADKQAVLEKLGFKFITDKYGIHKDLMFDPTIEIATIEELMAFVAEHGEIVLGSNTIEIYDGYRE